MFNLSTGGTKDEIIVKQKGKISLKHQKNNKHRKPFQMSEEARVINEKNVRYAFKNKKGGKNCPNICCKFLFQTNKVDSTTRDIYTTRNSKHEKIRKSKNFGENYKFNIRRSLANEKSRDVGNSYTLNEKELEKVGFKTLLTMFLKRSSIYALNQVGNSTTTRRKIFWLLILIFGLLGSGYFVGQYLSAYFSYPVVVNMDSEMTLTQEFPAVTLCNFNRIRKEFLLCVKNQTNYMNCQPSEVGDVESTPSFINDTNDPRCRNFFKNVSGERIEEFLWRNRYATLDADSREYYGHQRSDFIRSCFFNGAQCSEEDFSTSVDFEYGNCFTFNSANNNKPALNTSFIGPLEGLELEIDLEVKKYAHFTKSIGARVEVHDPYHAAVVNKKGVNIGPGLETFIALTRIQMLRLPKPFKDHCVEYDVGDNMQKCTNRCRTNSTLTYCSCAIDNSKNARFCDLTKLSELCCVVYNQNYECYCPLSCKDTDYTMNVFSTMWPADAYYKLKPILDEDKNALSIEEIRKSRLKLKIYYDTLDTTIYVQKAMYQRSELFSQIGGQMGLWLGLSLVAVFECFESFVLLWKYRLKHLNERRHLKY